MWWRPSKTRSRRCHEPGLGSRGHGIGCLASRRPIRRRGACCHGVRQRCVGTPESRAGRHEPARRCIVARSQRRGCQRVCLDSCRWLRVSSSHPQDDLLRYSTLRPDTQGWSRSGSDLAAGRLLLDPARRGGAHHRGPRQRHPRLHRVRQQALPCATGRRGLRQRRAAAPAPSLEAGLGGRTEPIAAGRTTGRLPMGSYTGFIKPSPAPGARTARSSARQLVRDLRARSIRAPRELAYRPGSRVVGSLIPGPDGTAHRRRPVSRPKVSCVLRRPVRRARSRRRARPRCRSTHIAARAARCSARVRSGRRWP